MTLEALYSIFESIDYLCSSIVCIFNQDWGIFIGWLFGATVESTGSTVTLFADSFFIHGAVYTLSSPSLTALTSNIPILSNSIALVANGLARFFSTGFFLPFLEWKAFLVIPAFCLSAGLVVRFIRWVIHLIF